MLACSTCNLCKHDKPMINRFNPEQRLLNCTNENEFPEHITEAEDGSWQVHTPAGFYHVKAIGLDEPCHTKKRAMRRKLAERILALYTHAIQYVGQNPVETHHQIMRTVGDLMEALDCMPPLVTKEGVLSVRQWLVRKGVKLD